MKLFANWNIGGRRTHSNEESTGLARLRLRFARCRGFGYGICSAPPCPQNFGGGFWLRFTVTDYIFSTTFRLTFHPIRTCWVRLSHFMPSAAYSRNFPGQNIGENLAAKSCGIK